MWLGLLSGGAAQGQMPPEAPPTPMGQRPYLDGRDHWILRSRRLINHQLDLQLAQPDQRGRALADRRAEGLPFAADAQSGLRFPVLGGAQGQYHGFYLADLYGGVTVLDGISISFNPSFYHPSASDGYRLTSRVKAGLGIYLEAPLTEIDGDPLIGRALVHDLDRLTFGEGLMLQMWPLEGNAAGLYWRGFSIDQYMIGRSLWPSDDIYALTFGALDRLITLNALYWFFGRHGEEYDHPPSVMLSASAHTPEETWWRLGAEWAVNASRQRWAAMIRGDIQIRDWGPLTVHLGQQLRYYQGRFSPQRAFYPTQALFNLPWREYDYVTNAAEFMDGASDFAQIAWTTMIEARLAVTDRLMIFGDAEGLWRKAEPDEARPYFYIERADGTPLPGESMRWFYRGGLTWRFWADRPHRLRTFLTNKQINDTNMMTLLNEPNVVSRRFFFATVWALELEVRL